MNISLNVIYGLKAINEDRIRYVGRTSVGIESRFKDHLYTAEKNPTKSLLYRWMSRIGTDRVEYAVLETLPSDATIDELNLREVAWIAELKTHYTSGGLNSTFGGQGRMSGYRHTEATRAAIAKSLTGKKFSEERRLKLSKSHLGISNGPRSEETRKKISETLKGHPVSDEARKRMSIAGKGRKVSESHAISNRKAVHIRWHVNRGLVKDGCEWCID